MEEMNPLVLVHGQDGEADGHGPSRRGTRVGWAFSAWASPFAALGFAINLHIMRKTLHTPIIAELQVVYMLAFTPISRTASGVHVMMPLRRAVVVCASPAIVDAYVGYLTIVQSFWFATYVPVRGIPNKRRVLVQADLNVQESFSDGKGFSNRSVEALQRTGLPS